MASGPTMASPMAAITETTTIVVALLRTRREKPVRSPAAQALDSVGKAATEMADHLAQEVFPAYRVGLLHGRMKADAKERVMKAFVAALLTRLPEEAR